jgi:hypothetical protein
MKRSKSILCLLLLSTFILTCWKSVAAEDSPLFGATTSEAIAELKAPPQTSANNVPEVEEIKISNMKKMTSMPEYATTCGATTCIQETTACQTNKTQCGPYTHCVSNNESGLYCPKPTKWPSTLATRCPDKASTTATVCPVKYTKCPPSATRCPSKDNKVKTACPQKRTKCPDVQTQCPKEKTICPAEKTKCVDVQTKCPKEKTVCPTIRTKCPVETTNCPRKKTVCSSKSTTKCPKEATACPREATKCVGEGTATVCPVKKTQCPVVATKCNAGGATLCPFVATKCPAGVTWCPANPTFCPLIATKCIAAKTICPGKATACPPRPTLCPKIAANCPPPPDLQTIIINEIFWSGSDLSEDDKYLELYNASKIAIDVSGWEIWKLNDDGDAELMITLPSTAKEVIAAGGYYLITYYPTDSPSSRLLDSIEPDLITTELDLRDEDALYKLIDTNDIVRDVADDGEGFPFKGQDAPDYISMERTSSQKPGNEESSWQDSIAPSEDFFDVGFAGQGTPRAENSPSK